MSHQRRPQGPGRSAQMTAQEDWIAQKRAEIEAKRKLPPESQGHIRDPGSSGTPSNKPGGSAPKISRKNQWCAPSQPPPLLPVRDIRILTGVSREKPKKRLQRPHLFYLLRPLQSLLPPRPDLSPPHSQAAQTLRTSSAVMVASWSSSGGCRRRRRGPGPRPHPPHLPRSLPLSPRLPRRRRRLL